MSIPILTTAMLLASAPVSSEAVPPAAPAPLTASTTNIAGAQAHPPATAATVETPLTLSTPVNTPTGTSAGTAAAPEATAPEPDPEADQNDIVVSARRHVPEDPLETVNAESFAVIQSVDKAFVGPVAMRYEHGVPKPVRHGLRNFLGNLEEPVVFTNFLIQHRLGKAAETLGRFLINSTLGVAGLFDVAKKPPFKLPRRANGFANSMAFYGIATGPYMFLPLIGPTTVRDVIGRIMDMTLVPMAVGKPFNRPYYTLTAGAIRLLNDRNDSDARLRKLRESSDPYKAVREEYLQRRKAEVEVLHSRHHDQPSPADAPVTPTTEQPTPLTTNATPPAAETSSVPPAAVTATPLAPAPGSPSTIVP